VTRVPEALDVPVRGGRLRVARWPADREDAPTVVAAHGITANHLAWRRVADTLDGTATLLAPDLRGRGASGSLPRPYGLAAHADDLAAVLDHQGVDRAVALGHSMGGFVAANLAERHGGRVERLVLVDGGYAFAIPEHLDVDEALQVTIGPAMERLRRSFPSVDAYLDFWRPHPAMAAAWDQALEEYLAYDLVGTPPDLRSACSLEAVRVDGADTIGGTARDAVLRVTHDTTLLWAERGMFDETPGMYDAERVARLEAAAPHLHAERVDDVNHYTVLFAGQGARAVVRALGL